MVAAVSASVQTPLPSGAITCYMNVATFSETGRVRAVGLAGAAIQVVFAAIMALLAGRPDTFPNPPHLIPRGVALGVLFALPAIIGAIGALRGRRSLLAAAAVLSAFGSVLSFSGITLLFLAPALMFGAAAGPGGDTTQRQKPSWHAVGILVLAATAVVVASLQLGIFVIPLIVLLVVALQLSRGATRGGGRTTQPLRGLVAALAIVALVGGAGVALLGMTGTQCWRAYRTPAGIEYRDAPGTVAAGTINLGPDEIAGGCESGVPTPAGLAVASLLSLAAIGIAVATARRDLTEVLSGAR